MCGWQSLAGASAARSSTSASVCGPSATLDVSALWGPPLPHSVGPLGWPGLPAAATAGVEGPAGGLTRLLCHGGLEAQPTSSPPCLAVYFAVDCRAPRQGDHDEAGVHGSLVLTLWCRPANPAKVATVAGGRWGMGSVLAQGCPAGSKRARKLSRHTPARSGAGSIQRLPPALLPASCRQAAAPRGNVVPLRGKVYPADADAAGPSSSLSGSATASSSSCGIAGASSTSDLEAGIHGRQPASAASASRLPFKPISLTFSDVQYSVPYPKARQNLGSEGGVQEGAQACGAADAQAAAPLRTAPHPRPRHCSPFPTSLFYAPLDLSLSRAWSTQAMARGRMPASCCC